MKTNNITIKQEAFCQAYVRLGDKSAAYREAYSCGGMKMETVNKRANELSKHGEVSGRIEFLRNEIKEDNKVTIGEIVSTLSDMLRFDIGELYDENGKLKNIHDIPKKARIMISQLDTDEIKAYMDGESIVVGQTKKLKVFDKLQAVEKLMKHLGGYAVDNSQKKPEIIIGDKEAVSKRVDELIAKRDGETKKS